MRQVNSRIAGIFGAALFNLVALPAQASLIGATVDISSPQGGCSGVTVGDGVECSFQDFSTLLSSTIAIDVQDSSVIFEFSAPNTGGSLFVFNTQPFTFDVVVSGLIWVDDPDASIASIDVTTELFGTPGTIGTPDGISAAQSGPNAITLTFDDLVRTDCPTVVCARLTVDIQPEQSQLPEPGSLALFGLGLAGLGVALQKRRQR